MHISNDIATSMEGSQAAMYYPTQQNPLAASNSSFSDEVSKPGMVLHLLIFLIREFILFS